MEPVKDGPGRTYAGQTSDERAEVRRAALLGAAFDLVSRDGWRALRIDAVCRAASLNKRYFYEGFTDLDALIAELTRGLADEAIAVTMAAMAPGGPPPEVTRRAIAALVAHLTDDPRRARVLFGAVPAGDAAAGHQALALRQIITSTAAIGGDLHGLPAAPFVDTAAAMLVGGTSQAILDWLDGRITSAQAGLVDDLVRLWLAVGDAAEQVRRRGVV
jgi:AcrR family transcriptional regulator